MLTYRLGPTFLFEEHLSANVIATMFRLGPSYLGSFQAPTVQDMVSSRGGRREGVGVEIQIGGRGGGLVALFYGEFM